MPNKEQSLEEKLMEMLLGRGYDALKSGANGGRIRRSKSPGVITVNLRIDREFGDSIMKGLEKNGKIKRTRGYVIIRP